MSRFSGSFRKMRVIADVAVVDGLEDFRPDGGMDALVFGNDLRLHVNDMAHALHVCILRCFRF